jgi:hypothetical protein
MRINHVVRRTQIIGSNLEVFEVWERTYDDRYSTITFINGLRYGLIGTRCPPINIVNMPAYSEERRAAFAAWQGMEFNRAYKLIFREWPELEHDPTAKFDAGEIRVQIAFYPEDGMEFDDVEPDGIYA